MVSLQPSFPMVVICFECEAGTDEQAAMSAAHEVYRVWRAGFLVVALVAHQSAASSAGPPAPISPSALPDTVSDPGKSSNTQAAFLAHAIQSSGMPCVIIAASCDSTAHTEVSTRTLLEVVSAPTQHIVVIDQPLTASAASARACAQSIARSLGGSCLVVKREFAQETALSKQTPSIVAANNTGASRHLSQALYAALPVRLKLLDAPTAGLTGQSDADEPRPTVKPLRIAMLGCGTVGGGVLQRILSLNSLFTVVGIATRNPESLWPLGVSQRLIWSDPIGLVEEPCDVVIELIGGLKPAHEALRRALQLGKHVVTANKALLCSHGPELFALAQAHGSQLRYSAAVGGAMPALEAAARMRAQGGVAMIRGVLNSTTNFVLDQMALGMDLVGAIRAAQIEGYAEADPTLDINGTDSAQKLILLSRVAFGIDAGIEAVDLTGIENVDRDWVRRSSREGNPVRLVASASFSAGRLSASVKPVTVSASDPLAHLGGPENCLMLTAPSGNQTVLRAQGAGRWPTTAAVMADVFDILQSSATLPAPINDQVSANRL